MFLPLLLHMDREATRIATLAGTYDVAAAGDPFVPAVPPPMPHTKDLDLPPYHQHPADPSYRPLARQAPGPTTMRRLRRPPPGPWHHHLESCIHSSARRPTAFRLLLDPRPFRLRIAPLLGGSPLRCSPIPSRCHSHPHLTGGGTARRISPSLTSLFPEVVPPAALSVPGV